MSEKLPPHIEEYIVLGDVTHESALITWGAFFFRVKSKDGKTTLLDDDDLKKNNLSRSDSIGATSQSYGAAYVEVEEPNGSVRRVDAAPGKNHCWIDQLQPDTRYRYWVTVGGKTWAAGPLWDWDPFQGRLVQGAGVYRNEFRTHPHPAAPLDSMAFAVIGDFGKGVKKVDKVNGVPVLRGQAQVAKDLAETVEEHDVRAILTTGDNIYASRKFLLVLTAEGDEDDDWFFTYYQPYRYLLNRIPVYPALGNHDSTTESREDRSALVENLYMEDRLERMEGTRPGSTVMKANACMYRFRYGRDVEFVALDTADGKGPYTTHTKFIDEAFPPAASQAPVRWKIPFFHHPPFCGGPLHPDDAGVKAHLVPRFEASGVKLVLSGHEHNYQHWIHDGIHYFVTGAAGSLRDGKVRSRSAPNVPEGPASWAAEYHHLLVTLGPDKAEIKAIAAGRRPFDKAKNPMAESGSTIDA